MQETTAMHHQEKVHAMRALEEEIIAKDITPELARQAMQLVIGDGNLNADIVFIGEAPGKKEDEQGLPFIGAAGKLLNEMLAAIDMNRSDVYITNIVKYRPSNNRDPSKQEKAAFWPYLLRQLEIITPQVIVTLGRHSMGYFLPDTVIGEVHGKPQHVQLNGREVTLIPLYHPAAAFRNGALRQTLMDDFLTLPDILEQLK